MAKEPIEGLLKPSLSEDDKPVAFYSFFAHMMVAWFGGVIAIVPFCIMNLVNAKLWRQHTTLVSGMIVFALLTSIIMVLAALGMVAIPGLDADQSVTSQLRLYNKILATVTLGVFYLRFQRYFKASNLSGDNQPKPWIPAIVCVLSGVLLYVGMIMLAGYFGGVAAG